MRTKKNRIATIIRIDAEIHEELTEFCEAHGFIQNSIIQLAIEKYIREYEKKRRARK